MPTRCTLRGALRHKSLNELSVSYGWWKETHLALKNMTHFITFHQPSKSMPTVINFAQIVFNGNITEYLQKQYLSLWKDWCGTSLSFSFKGPLTKTYFALPWHIGHEWHGPLPALRCLTSLPVLLINLKVLSLGSGIQTESSLALIQAPQTFVFFCDKWLLRNIREAENEP